MGALPGGKISQAYGINNKGQVVGGSTKSTAQWAQGVLWDKGSPIALGILPGWKHSVAKSINARGQVVGASFNSIYSGDSTVFLWEDGVMTELKTLLVSAEGITKLWEVGGINDSGQVVGLA